MQNIKETALEVVYAIMPITALVFILQFTIIFMPAQIFIQFLIGVLMVGIGLILFLLGVHTGLLPLGEMIGSSLPKTGKMGLVVFFGFVLGLVVTIAEPDVRVLATQVDLGVRWPHFQKHFNLYRCDRCCYLCRFSDDTHHT